MLSPNNNKQTQIPPHYYSYQAGELSLPAPDASFCARCQEDISRARVTVRIEGRVYCANCELGQEQMNEGLDVLFNEVREVDYEQAPVEYEW